MEWGFLTVIVEAVSEFVTHYRSDGSIIEGSVIMKINFIFKNDFIGVRINRYSLHSIPIQRRVQNTSREC